MIVKKDNGDENCVKETFADRITNTFRWGVPSISKQACTYCDASIESCLCIHMFLHMYAILQPKNIRDGIIDERQHASDKS